MLQELLGGPARVYELSEYKMILDAKNRHEGEWQKTLIHNSNFPELNSKIMGRLKSKSSNHKSPYQDEEVDLNMKEAMTARYVWGRDFIVPRISHCIRNPGTEVGGKEEFTWAFSDKDKVRCEIFNGTYESSVPVLLKRGVFKAGAASVVPEAQKKFAVDLIAMDVKWGIFTDREEDAVEENVEAVSKEGFLNFVKQVLYPYRT